METCCRAEQCGISHSTLHDHVSGKSKHARSRYFGLPLQEETVSFLLKIAEVLCTNFVNNFSWLGVKWNTCLITIKIWKGLSKIPFAFRVSSSKSEYQFNDYLSDAIALAYDSRAVIHSVIFLMLLSPALRNDPLFIHDLLNECHH